MVSVVADLEAAKQQARDAIDELMDELDGDRFVICLSDDFDNFRHQIDPTYKGNRKNGVRPQELYVIKDWLADTFTHKRIETLEADDVMGLMATNPSRKEDRIIVSEDKDMRTIPGLIYHPQRPLVGVMDISELDAIRFHFWQTICGDTTDGYPGAKGVGKKSDYAMDVLGAADELEAWDIVTDAFNSVGLTEAHAVRQARLAFILRHGYLVDGKPRLWLPPARTASE